MTEMTSIKNCNMTMAELTALAWAKNPLLTDSLGYAWENTDMTNMEYVTGL